MALNIVYVLSSLVVLLVMLNSVSYSFTCNFIDSSSLLVCSGKGQCIGNDNCTCLSGYAGNYCEQSYDPLAGYRVVSNADLKVQNVPTDKLVTVSSLCVLSMSIQKYVGNESAVITYSTGALGQSLINHAQNILAQVDVGPCQYTRDPYGTELTIINGGIYCFPYGWTPPSPATITVVGTEPAVLRISYNFQCTDFNFVFFDGASYRNVYYIVSVSSSIRGNFEGVMVLNGGSLSYNTGVLKGAIWYFGGSFQALNFDNVRLTAAPLTWDPYTPLSSFNNVTKCFTIVSTDASVCSGKGTCVSYNTCSCNSGYGGSNCSIPYCNGIIYSNSSACLGRGVCVSGNQCSCNAGFYGSNCEFSACFGVIGNSSNVCSSHGSCVATDTCSCHEHYYGSMCQHTSCFNISSSSPQVCSSSGSCIGYNQCQCNEGNEGVDCAVARCFSELSNSTNVCSGKGYCSSPNNCTCNEHYFGLTCNTTMCNSILSNSLNVCSGKGECVSFNNCTCQLGYSGDNCQQFVSNGSSSNNNSQISTCFGIQSNSNFVCNSHGTCIGFDICNCSTGYIGANCSLQSFNNAVPANNSNQVPSCFGILANNSNVCSGRGSCENHDTCSCNNSYGPNCDISTCSGILSNSSQVCSGKGSCTGNNNCACTQGYYGDNCQLFKCFQIDRYNQSVCSNGRGQCVGVDTCTCSPNYHGAMCQETLCFGVKSENSSVCSGKGKCVDFNVCECNNSYQGNSCESFANVTIPSVVVNSTTNSSTPVMSNSSGNSNSSSLNGTNSNSSNSTGISTSNSTNSNYTKPENSSNSSNSTNNTNPATNSSNSSNSTNNNNTNPANSSSNSTGIPSNNSTNSNITGNSNTSNTNTNSSSTNNSASSNSTSNSTSGEHCSGFIEGPLVFTNDFKGVTFHIRICSPNSSPSNQCYDLIHPTDLPMFGLSTGMKCGYINETNNLFMISFGNRDFKIKSGDEIRLKNQNASSNVEYLSFKVASPLMEILPVSEIETSNLGVVGEDSDIVFDGSTSSSEDGRPLTYIWELVNVSNNSQVIAQFPDQPFVKFGSQILPDGQYAITLKVKSETSTWQSNTTIYYFSKVSQPLPSINLPESNLEVYTHQLPVTIRKTVSENDGKYVVEWEQLSGPPIDYYKDSFDNLCINSLATFGNNVYTFRVVSYNSSTPEWKVYSKNVTLVTKTQATTLEIVQTEVNENFTKFSVTFNDPEKSVNTKLEDTWKWSVSNYSNPALVDFLDKISKEKSTSVTISSSLFGPNTPQSVSLTLHVSLSDGRNVSYTTMVYFANIPPLAWSSLDLNIQKPIVKGQIINVHVFPISNLDTTKTKILLNSVLMSESSFFSIDTSNLAEGSSNVITIVAFNAVTGESTETTYYFTMAISPKPCFCAVYPREGIALQSTFEFYCSNCKHSKNSIDYKYGFIDDRSGTKIYLRSLGDVYASKLPSPFQGSNLTCFFDIIDTATGASVTVLSNVTIIIPRVNKVEDVQGLVQLWSHEASQYMKVGDFSRSIYQSASTTRTDSVLLREAFALTSKRTLNRNKPVCVNGVDIAGKCKCVDGFIGEHCDKSVQDFSSIQSTKLQLLKDMFVVGNTTRVSNIKQEYVSLVAFAIDSLLYNYPYLNSLTISESLSTLNMFLSLTLSDGSLRLANGAEALLHQIIESAFRYIEDKSVLSDQTSNSLSLLHSLKMTVFLQAKYLLISEKQRLTGSFFSVVMGKSFVYDYVRVIEEPKTLARIEMETDVFYSQISKIENIRPFVYVVFVVQDIFGIDKRLKVQPTIVKGNEYQVSFVISPIVSIEIIDSVVDVNGMITYTLPINRTSVEIRKNGPLDITTEDKTYHCKNFHDGQSSIRSDCVLQSIGKDFAQCKCTRLTNVFVIETITNSYTSLYFIFIILGIIFLTWNCSFLLIVGLIILMRKYKPKKKKKVLPEDLELSVQKIVMKSLRYDSVPTISFKKQPTKKTQTVSITKKSQYNQVVPINDETVAELQESGSEQNLMYFYVDEFQTKTSFVSV